MHLVRQLRVCVESVAPESFLSLARLIYHWTSRVFTKLRCGLLHRWELWGTTAGKTTRIPPPMLRYRVGGTVDSCKFLHDGQAIVSNLLMALHGAGAHLEACNVILDFGCGCGRTLPWLARQFPNKHLYGTDVDGQAIEWCRRHIGLAEFSQNSASPPTCYPDAMFDLVFGVSVFTHLDADLQMQWLPELRRILAPGGFLLLTVHGRRVWKELRPEQVQRVESAGFLFERSQKLKGVCPDWYHTAYHSENYVRDSVGKFFTTLRYIPEGMGYQDVIIAKRP